MYSMVLSGEEGRRVVERRGRARREITSTETDITVLRLGTNTSNSSFWRIKIMINL